MSLLIVPMVLAGGGFLLNLAESERQRAVAAADSALQRAVEADRAAEATLQAYFDKITELLLQGHLANAERRGPGVENVARSKTITTLSRLDSDRKRQLLQLLLESKLITGDKPVVSLRGVDLRGANLAGAKLDGVDLFQAQLSGADLEGAKLRAANLREANMAKVQTDRPTNLRMADLRNAFLRGASLEGAQLDGADLRSTDLYQVDLRGASLNGTNLANAFMLGAKADAPAFDTALLCNTTLPDGAESQRDCTAIASRAAPQTATAEAAADPASAEPQILHARPIVSFAKVVGSYKVLGTNPGQGSGLYEGQVSLKVGGDEDALLISWKIGNDVWEGTGQITDDGQLYVIYTGAFEGDGIFSLMPDDSLTGTWRGAGTTVNGTERWTRL